LKVAYYHEFVYGGPLRFWTCCGISLCCFSLCYFCIVFNVPCVRFS